MRFGYILVFLTSLTLTWSAFGAASTAKTAAKTTSKKPAAKANGNKTSSAKTSSAKASGKSGPSKAAASRNTKASSKKGTKGLVKPVPARARQLQPTQDRYKEIQQALAEKGYLKSEPTGVWGPESVDALKQFQTEQSIPVTGKLNSRSLIGLGLGPKTAGPLVVPPPEPSAVRPQ